MFGRLFDLVPLLTTEAGLQGIQTGLDRWRPEMEPVRWADGVWIETVPPTAEGYRLGDGRVVDMNGNEITVDQEGAVA